MLELAAADIDGVCVDDREVRVSKPSYTFDTLNTIPGTAFAGTRADADWFEIDSSDVDTPGEIGPHADPYAFTPKHGAPAMPKVVHSVREA